MNDGDLNPDQWLALADAVLVVHALFVAFVVVGLVMIVIGNWRGIEYVNRLWFRLLHLSAILVVVVESWFGIDCPLTRLENHLRRLAGAEGYQTSFIEYWVGGLIFYDLPAVVFTLAYTTFAALVAFTWWKYPPR